MSPPKVHAFVSPGVKPDVRIKVFDNEFHVHSFILKHNSAFFRKFLDSPDKKPLASPPAPFKYEWVTKVDDDCCGWSVIAATEETLNTDPGRLADTSKQDCGEKAFNCILLAMYGQPYDLNHAAEFFILVELADYYCALPVVSRTLSSCLYRCRLALGLKGQFTTSLLVAAIKLRHAELFRDCAIILVGKWHFDYPTFVYKELKRDSRIIDKDACFDSQVFASLRVVHVSISVKLCYAHQKQMNIQVSSYSQDQSKFRSIDVPRVYPNDQNHPCAILPAYYRRLLNSTSVGNDAGKNLQSAIKTLLKSNLAFHIDQTKEDFAQAGEGEYAEYFLCGEISDKDLPWDTTELDW